MLCPRLTKSVLQKIKTGFLFESLTGDMLLWLNASIYDTALSLSCQQLLQLVLNRVVSIKRRPTLLPVQVRRLSPLRFLGVIQANMTFRSKSFSVVSAI